MHVRVAAGALRRNVGPRQRLADRCECRRLLQRYSGIDLQRQASIADERADADRRTLTAATHDSIRPEPDDAIHDRQLVRRSIEALRGEREKRLPRGRRGLTDFRAAARESGAAAGSALIGTHSRVAVDDGDAIGGDAELFGRHLRDRNPQSGADIDLAGVHGHRSVWMDCEEAVDVAGIERLVLRLRLRARPSWNRRIEREADDERAAGLQEIATGNIHHSLLSDAWAEAARTTARRIRVCVPQRQRLPASARLACSAVAFGVRASSAAVAMIM